MNKQRGGGVFDRSIAALQALNAAGYGAPGSGLQLDLVYNPGGVFLAPPQAKLQEAYKQASGAGGGGAANWRRVVWAADSASDTSGRGGEEAGRALERARRGGGGGGGE